MREWFSARDLAGLPGMPKTKAGVIHRADNESWKSQPRKGRGGGREYHITSLPEATRIHLATQAASVPVSVASMAPQPTPASNATQTSPAALSGTAQARMDARLAVLDAAQTFVASSGLGVTRAMASFVHHYNDGQIQVNGHRHYVSEICVQTLYRWKAQLKTQGAAALGGHYGNRKGSGKIDTQPELRDFLVAMLTEHPHVQGKQLYAAATARFNDHATVEIPSLRRLQDWQTKYRKTNAELLMAVTNPDQWKNQHMAAFGSYSEDVTSLNEKWEFDGTPADLMLSDGRHQIVGVIDVYSRRTRLLVTQTAKATAVASLLRSTISEWGVPQVAKTDNGSDYTSHHMRRAFQVLDIQQELCAPFSAWQKPHIERFFRTFSHDLVEMLPGYIGHNVAERSAIEARKAFSERLFKKDNTVELNMTAADFQKFCDNWIKTVYHNNVHDSLNGLTPNETAATWHGNIRRIEDERVLDILLADAPGDGTRTVTKKGIRIDRMEYIHAELGLWVGQQVRVLYDPADVGRVMVFDLAHAAFICVAECPEVTGISRQEVATHAKRAQKEAIQEAKRELKKAAKKQGVKEITQEILAYRGGLSTQPGQLLEFPKPTVPHTSDGISAAMDALTAQSEPAAPSPQLAAAQAEFQAEFAARQQAAQQQPETPPQRYRRWCALNATALSGESVSDDDARWLKIYPKSVEYEVQHHMAEEFDGHIPLKNHR